MKQLEPIEKGIGENAYYIRPFPAFKAANIAGELANILFPILGAVAPIVGSENVNMMDVDISKAVPAMSNSLNALSGDKVEALLKKLLIEYKNIGVHNSETGKTEILDMDKVNELFCGNAQDMFILAYYVIAANFNGFFKRLGSLSGGLSTIVDKMVSPS